MTQEQLEEAVRLENRRKSIQGYLKELERGSTYLSFRYNEDYSYSEMNRQLEDLLSIHSKAIINELKSMIEEIDKQIAEL